MSDRRRAAPALVALLVSVVLAAGCSQEGRLIDTPLPVNGVSFDRLAIRDTIISGVVTKFFDIHFKVSIHAANPCERVSGLLELRREGPAIAPVFIIRPVARYNADDRCANDPPGESDSVLTLSVVGTGVTALDRHRFRVETSNGPAIEVPVDSSYHSPVASTIQFEVHVEAQATGDSVAGASVTLEDLSGATPGLPATDVTDASGIKTFTVASTAAAGVATLPYRVTVTNGVTTRVLSMPAFPARGQSREIVYIRL